jgi:hypothetical protein
MYSKKGKEKEDVRISHANQIKLEVTWGDAIQQEPMRSSRWEVVGQLERVRVDH